MSIQNSLLGAVGSVSGALVAAKHIKNQKDANAKQDEALKAQDEKEIGQAEGIMTEAALKGSGKFGEKDINAYLAASMLGMKPTAEYQPKYDEMRREVSDTVLQSETYAKMQQDRAFRQRILSLGSTQEGRDRLAQAVSPMEKEDKK